jgi:hypothetical protein
MASMMFPRQRPTKNGDLLSTEQGAQALSSSHSHSSIRQLSFEEKLLKN